MKLTIQQAMTRRGNLQSELNNLSRRIQYSWGIVTVDGKDVVSKVILDQFNADIKRSNEIIKENAELATKIQEANINTLLDGQSVTYWLNYLKQKRNLIYGLSSERSNSVTSGVGVTESDYPNRELALAEREIEKELNVISAKIDTLNNEIKIELD